MAIAIHRTTKQIRDSVHGPGLDPLEWLIYYKRDVPAEVRAAPEYYRIIDDEEVRVATAQEIVAIDAQIAIDAANQAAAQLAARKTQAQDNLDGIQDPDHTLIRALALVLMNEINLLRSWITKYKAEVAIATNLANLQTRVAALPNVPQRTADQLRIAIKDEIVTGNADS